MSTNIGAYLKDALLNNISTVNELSSEDVFMKNLRDKFKHLWEVIEHSYNENPLEHINVENKLCNFMTRINEKSDASKQKKESCIHSLFYNTNFSVGQKNLFKKCPIHINFNKNKSRALTWLKFTV